MENENTPPRDTVFDVGIPSSLRHPDAPKFEKKSPAICRDNLIFKIKSWIIREQMSRSRRYGDDEQLYNHQIGYMLCLSNLAELLMELEYSVDCSVSGNSIYPPDVVNPDRDF